MKILSASLNIFNRQLCVYIFLVIASILSVAFNDSSGNYSNENEASNKYEVKKKELELKEKDLDLKEKEMNLSYSQFDSHDKKEISFEEFANTFMSDGFNSSNNFSFYSERSIMTVSIEGNIKTSPSKEYKEVKRWRDDLYDKYSVNENSIYIYGIIYEYQPEGSEQGMTFFFRKNNDKEWKLFKIEYEGC